MCVCVLSDINFGVCTVKRMDERETECAFLCASVSCDIWAHVC